MESLDFYMSTPDDLFNHNANEWYFKFKNKAQDTDKTDKPFLVFVHALHDTYFFILDNPNKPFACIARIRSVFGEHSFNQQEQLLLTMKLLGVLAYHSDILRMELIYKHLLDLSNEIYPWIEDPELRNSKIPFNYQDLKNEVDTIDVPEEKIRHVRNFLLDLKEASGSMEAWEQEYYVSEVVPKCENLLTRIRLNKTVPSDVEYLLPLATLQRVHSEFNGEMWEDVNLNVFYSLFDINNKRKLDFKVIKVVDFYALLWSMYEVAKPIPTKEQYIKPLLERYGHDFGSFGNIKSTRINSDSTKARALMRRINEALK